MLLQGEVNIGSEVVDPDLLCLLLRTCEFFIKENDFSLDTGLI